MAMAVALEERNWELDEWPITREAWEALDADTTRLTAQVLEQDGYVSGRLDGDTDAPTFIPNVVGQQLLRQLDSVHDVMTPRPSSMTRMWRSSAAG